MVVVMRLLLLKSRTIFEWHRAKTSKPLYSTKKMRNHFHLLVIKSEISAISTDFTLKELTWWRRSLLNCKIQSCICPFRCQKFSWTKRLSHALHSGDSQGYSTVGEPPAPLRCLSLPPHTYPSETDEDLTISPYASYTSLTERAPPIISGWLDKLSPQGCVWFTQLVRPERTKWSNQKVRNLTDTLPPVLSERLKEIFIFSLIKSNVINVQNVSLCFCVCCICQGSEVSAGFCAASPPLCSSLCLLPPEELPLPRHLPLLLLFFFFFILFFTVHSVCVCLFFLPLFPPTTTLQNKKVLLWFFGVSFGVSPMWVNLNKYIHNYFHYKDVRYL